MFKYGFGRITCGACSASIGLRADGFKNTNNNENCVQQDECDHFKFENTGLKKLGNLYSVVSFFCKKNHAVV